MVEIEPILRLVTTLVILPVWIGLCFVLPYIAGRAFNGLLLRGKSFKGISLFLSFIAGINFLFIFIFILGTSIIEFLNFSESKLWFKEFLPPAILANAIGVVCSLAVGFSMGKVKRE